MSVEKLAVSLERKLAEAVRADAARSTEGNVSAWIARAAERELRQRHLEELVDTYESEQGAFTDEELAEAGRL